MFGSAIFGGRVEKPLLALSLESGEATTEAAPPPSTAWQDDDEDEFYPPDAYQLRRIASSQRFYDMVLGVLHVLESQARQKVQRAREQRENFTLAARLRRDVVEDGVTTIKKTITDTFTKENVDTFFNKLGEMGELFKSKTSELGDTIQQKVKEDLLCPIATLALESSNPPIAVTNSMAKLLCLILALCAVQGTLGFVRRDAPAAPAEEPNFFQTIMNIKDKIEVAFEETQQNVLKSLGFQSNEEVVQTIQQNTNQYVDRLRSVQGVLDEEVKKHSDIFEPIVKDLKVKLDQTTATLSEQNPEVVQKAKEYQEQLTTNVQSLVAEAQKTVEKLKADTRVQSEEMQKALKMLYDSTFEVFTKTANELKQPKN
uniref:Uncharacterized protein n=3 Tax=Anopheles stephensi TaxID=30069 RepID=A0A182XVI9_ANOST